MVNIGAEDLDIIGLTIAVKIKTAVFYRQPQSVLQFLQPRKFAFSVNTTIFDVFIKRYDTILDAILTCARKPTWIGLIYRTETTTKNCKTEKLKVKADMLKVTVKVVRSEKKKKKGYSGKDLQKKVLCLEWKREWMMKN